MSKGHRFDNIRVGDTLYLLSYHFDRAVTITKLKVTDIWKNKPLFGREVVIDVDQPVCVKRNKTDFNLYPYLFADCNKIGENGFSKTRRLIPEDINVMHNFNIASNIILRSYDDVLRHLCLWEK